MKANAKIVASQAAHIHSSMLNVIIRLAALSEQAKAASQSAAK